MAMFNSKLLVYQRVHNVPKSQLCQNRRSVFRRLPGYTWALRPQLRATHRAEMRVLPSIMSNRLVMHLAGGWRDPGRCLNHQAVLISWHIALIIHWIGFVGKIYRKPWFLPSNIWGFPVIFPSSNSMNCRLHGNQIGQSERVNEADPTLQ